MAEEILTSNWDEELDVDSLVAALRASKAEPAPEKEDPAKTRGEAIQRMLTSAQLRELGLEEKADKRAFAGAQGFMAAAGFDPTRLRRPVAPQQKTSPADRALVTSLLNEIEAVRGEDPDAVYLAKLKAKNTLLGKLWEKAASLAGTYSTAQGTAASNRAVAIAKATAAEAKQMGELREDIGLTAAAETKRPTLAGLQQYLETSNPQAQKIGNYLFGLENTPDEAEAKRLVEQARAASTARAEAEAAGGIGGRRVESVGTGMLMVEAPFPTENEVRMGKGRARLGLFAADPLTGTETLEVLLQNDTFRSSFVIWDETEGPTGEFVPLTEPFHTLTGEERKLVALTEGAREALSDSLSPEKLKEASDKAMKAAERVYAGDPNKVKELIGSMTEGLVENTEGMTLNDILNTAVGLTDEEITGGTARREAHEDRIEGLRSKLPSTAPPRTRAVIRGEYEALRNEEARKVGLEPFAAGGPRQLDRQIQRGIKQTYKGRAKEDILKRLQSRRGLSLLEDEAVTE